MSDKTLDELYKLQNMNRFVGEMICWKIHILESKLIGEDLELYEKSIKENKEKLKKLLEKG